MQPNTGHLVDTTEADKKTLKKLQKAGYEEVPSELQEAARRKLAGKKEALVSLTSGGKLSRHAAQLRKKRRKLAERLKRLDEKIDSLNAEQE